MRFASRRSPMATLLLLASTATPSLANMAAWFTERGPQVMVQNKTTGLIHYSACNVDDQAPYSPTDERTLEGLNFKPKKDSPITGAGYYDDHKSWTVASLYYVDENNAIISAVFNCNMTTGLFWLEGAWVISGAAPSPLSPNTGLSVILLGQTSGYRLYYHDENMAVNELYFLPSNGQWEHKALISQDPQGSSAIAAAFTGSANITVVTGRDKENMEAIRYYNDTTWRITTFPHPLEGDLITMDTNPEEIVINSTAEANYSLPAWTGSPGAIAMSVDAKYTRSVWYIGNDNKLYQIANKNSSWRLQDSQPADIWPAADSPNAPLAVASDFTTGMLRIYYEVNGTLAEINGDGGQWQNWSTLPTPAPIPTEIPSPPPSNTSTSEGNSGGLSNGAKIGLGVGISLGVVTLGVLTAAFLILRRKRAGLDSTTIPSTAGSDATAVPYNKPTTGGGSSSSSGSSPSTQYSGVVVNHHHQHHHQQHPAWDEENKGYYYPDNNAAMMMTHGAAPAIYQLDSASRPAELDSPRPLYELSDQPNAHELMVSGGDGGEHASRTADVSRSVSLATTAGSSPGRTGTGMEIGAAKVQ